MIKTILPLLFILLSCGESVKEKFHTGRCNDIKSIVIYDKTASEYRNDSITINKSSELNRICKELNNLKDVSITSAQANFGFFELEATFSNGSNYEVLIIYSRYDGVLIRDESGKFYKNDLLENNVINIFQR